MIAFIVLMLSFFALMGAKAQIVQKGTNFSVQKNDSTAQGGVTKTLYTFTDAKGVTDTIYLSRNGNAFIFKVSKTGKVYRKYLPEVTRKLGTKKK